MDDEWDENAPPKSGGKMPNKTGEGERGAAAKFDGDKIRLDLLPLDALTEVGKVLTDGCVKYGDRNWEKGLSYSRVFGAIMRHLWQFWTGHDRDSDGQKRLHLAHAATECLFLLALFLRKSSLPGLDDRPGTCDPIEHMTVQKMRYP